MVLKLISSVFGGFNLLLWVAAVASLAGYIMELSSIGKSASMDNLFLFIVLTVVVAGTGLFDFYQERKSGNIMKSFANMIPPKAHVSGADLRRIHVGMSGRSSDIFASNSYIFWV